MTWYCSRPMLSMAVNQATYFAQPFSLQLVLSDFPRILRRKNEEDAERNFHFPQFHTTLKGQYFEKIEWGIFKQKFISLYLENTYNSEKRKETGHITVNNGST
jgi:hypothetical protein